METGKERIIAAFEFLKRKFKNKSFPVKAAEKYMHFTMIRQMEEAGYLKKMPDGRYRLIEDEAVVA